MKNFRVRVSIFALLIALPVLSGTTCAGILPGTPSPQDGLWTVSTVPPGAIGFSNILLQVGLDRITRINVAGADWTITQSFPSNRTNDRIAWQVIAAPPPGTTGPLAVSNINFLFDTALQANNTLSGTLTENIVSILPVFGSPFTISMSRF